MKNTQGWTYLWYLTLEGDAPEPFDTHKIERGDFEIVFGLDVRLLKPINVAKVEFKKIESFWTQVLHIHVKQFIEDKPSVVSVEDVHCLPSKD